MEIIKGKNHNGDNNSGRVCTLPELFFFNYLLLYKLSM